MVIKRFIKKKDLDEHVEAQLKKINNETERNLRCLSFAKQYYSIERYDEARRYVSTYISARPNSPEAFCLLGKCLENLGRKESALEAYTNSLKLDPAQKKIVLKVCELLASDDIEFDYSDANYFCEMGQNLDPNNPTIMNLKHRIIESKANEPGEVTSFILKELESRPTDVKLRVRLLKHLIQNNLIKEAYKHATQIESRDLTVFQNNIAWYETLAEVLVKYQRSVRVNNSLDWEFWFFSISVLDKITSLSLAENEDRVKTPREYMKHLFDFDQTLSTAAAAGCPDQKLLEEFLNHFRAQICLHLATLIFKQAQKDVIKYKEAANITLPLLFAAYNAHPPDLQSVWFNHSSETRKNLLKKWRRDGAFRCSQAGHILLGAAKDRKTILLEKARQYSIGMWREQLFKKLFITRDQQLKMKSSFFLSDKDLTEVSIQLPEKSDLLKFDEEAQLLFPDSLHHHLWIALNNNLSDVKSTVFESLSYSIKNLKNCGAETINYLDIQAFIYSATLCAKYELDNLRQISYLDSDKPVILPAAVTRTLGSLNQEIFFKSAYKMTKNEFESNLDQVRLSLIDGIKTVRCIDHSLDIRLLVNLAKTFGESARKSSKKSEIEFNEARAEQYWKVALPILEKIHSGQAFSQPPNKLFTFRTRDFPVGEAGALLETGKLFNGQLLMKRKEYEKALRMFEPLRDPYASFYQAEIYKSMADQQTNQTRENVTSEMRSQNIILLSRARDCLYLTLDRLREPSVVPNHPLNTQLGTEIEKIERLLSRIDPDCSNRNECDGMSNETVSSADSRPEHYVTGLSIQNSFNNQNLHSTPYRSYLRREARPSPERLDAQLRQLAATKDAASAHMLEQSKIVVDSHKALVEELRAVKDDLRNVKEDLKNVHSYDDLREVKKMLLEVKESIEELGSFRTVTDMVFELKKELQELKKDVKTGQLTEEDIYGLSNEYSNEFNVNSNLAAYNPALYPNYQARLPGAGSIYGAPPLYPLYPGMYAYGMGLQGPLPFPEQLPLAPQDYRLMAGLAQPPPPQTTLPQTVQHPKITPVVAPPPPGPSKAAPANVVITNSDPLPTKMAAQPELSVTIPPHHLKGNKAHNYQIPLPSAAVATSSPAVLSKPAPALSSQSILSDVPSPMYSAVNKTPVGTNLFGVQKDSFGDAFKPAEGSWECKQCLVRNSSKDTKCCACETAKTGTGAVKPKETAGSFGDAFKPAEGSWECKQCLIRNVGKDTKCVACETGRDGVVKKETKGVNLETGMKFSFGMTPVASAPAVKAFGDAFKPPEGSWECKQCLIRNVGKDTKCVACETGRDGVLKKETGVALAPSSSYSFGLSSGANAAAAPTAFTFGQSSIQHGKITEAPFVFKPTTVVEKVEAKEGGQFVFGSPQKHDFGFNPRSPRRVSTGAKDEESDNSYLEEECDNIYFKPVIPLPDKVEVKTGEEDEEVLYCHRAKLFRFVGGEWKERGIGDIKILRRSGSGKLRVLMRRDQVFKICLNHMLTNETKYLAKDDKSWLFNASDFSEGELVNEHFCLRFKNGEIAQEFLQAVNNARDKAQTAVVAATAAAAASTDESDEGDVEFVNEMSVTAEEEAEALKLRLPAKFFAYRQLEDCECAQCKKDDVYYQAEKETTAGVKLPASTVPQREEITLKDLLKQPSPFGASSAFNQTRAPLSFTTPAVSSAESSVFSSPGTFKFTTTSAPFSMKSTGLFNTGSIFGGGAPAPVTNIFGTQSTAGNSPQTSIFGSPAASEAAFKTSTGSLFTGTASTSIFSSPKATTWFGKKDGDGSATATPPEPKNPQTSIFGGGLAQKEPPSNNIFGGRAAQSDSPAPASIFGPNTLKTTGFGLGSFPSFGAKTEAAQQNVPENTIVGKTSQLKEDDAVVLDSTSGLSFASLAANKPGEFAQVPKGTETARFSFLGAGTPVFSSGGGDKTSKAANLDESKDSGAADDEYDPHYDPIVPLPEVIVVTTGEEDEEIMFNERAKLFRYDTDTKEWKERGVGQMKILYHPVNKTYRFLLRREQVHKVVLNQLITVDLDLQPMKLSDKAWMWAGYNYTDDGSSLEKLAVRFKNSDIAQAFNTAAGDVIMKVKEKADLIPSTVDSLVSDISTESQEHYDDDEEEDDDDEEDERTLMFVKRCTLSEETDGAWTTVGLGELQVYYDPELYAARIVTCADDGQVLSNTVIGQNTVMEIEKNSCFWKAVELNLATPKYRMLKVTFSSTQAAEEFHSAYLEGVSYAQEFEIVDQLPYFDKEAD